MGLVEKHIGNVKVIKKFAKPALHSIDSTDSTTVLPKKQTLAVGKPMKKELTMADEDLDSLSSIYKNIKKDETPKGNIAPKNEESTRQESSTSTKDIVAKKEIPSSATSTKEESYELSEPNTVRSILDRAKEVLKTLDADALPGTDEIINKRGGIAKHANNSVDAKFVNDTARAVKQVAQLAQNLVKHAEEKKVLKNKTENLLKKSTAEVKPNNTPKQTVQQQQQQQTIVKKNILPRMTPRQFGNTP